MDVLVTQQENNSQKLDDMKKCWHVPEIQLLDKGVDIHGGGGGDQEVNGLWSTS